ncbi:3,9-dihydroxypterocarpan 6A-monooxygenase [Vitis vinifera]|uniref:3,9-dihydroxypterocarpan 6A-monooxygenase n=3 Tax=Vitis vinifera TaxID=29760 RepID=A0A438JLG8_VITVI|nr:3,9-dihydroxypterocarpan 6A-monooxygenase [Vitis vinifera]|eukprot:XP_002277130.1 PREDICTED: cytochrome P450 93A3 [Vitis vinifera]
MADFQNYIPYILIGLLSAIMVRPFFTKYRRTKLRLPPGPVALPIIGHLHLLLPVSNVHVVYQKLSWRYGPLMHFFFGSVPCVVVSSPEMAKELLQNQDVVFSNRPKKVVAELVAYGDADLTYAPYGAKWRFMKKLCMTELLGMQTIHHFGPIRREERNRLLQRLLKKAKAGEAVDVKAELLRLTGDIVSRMSMSRRCSDNEDEAAGVKKSILEMASMAMKLNVTDFIWFCKKLDIQGFLKKAKAARDKYDSMIERIISEHEEARRKKEAGDGNGEVKDLIDMLLDTTEDEKAEMRLTRENIKALMLNMIGGGTTSPAHAMEWALAELINRPNLMEKARHEIDSVVGKDRLVEESDITNLPYVEAIVRETLRLHPPGHFIVRESIEDCKVGGYDIPAKTQLIVNVWAIGRDPNSWENPLEFQPERFLNEGGINRRLNVRGQQFHLLPFGSGRRLCPGTTLALQVLHTTIAALIQCFDWKVNGNIDMKEGFGSTRATPLVCVPVVRLNPLPIYTS